MACIAPFIASQTPAMEIKVKCDCGTIYSFEEVPVAGRVAHPVSCTNCGVDGTLKANDYITRKLAQEFAPPAKPRRTGFFSFGRKKDYFAELEETDPPKRSEKISATGDE